jgi:hypothetical protein
VELTCGALLVVVLLGLAGYFAWQEVQELKRLRLPGGPPPDEARHLYRRAWRRLFCSTLLVIFAGLLIGTYFLEMPLQQLIAQRQAGDREFSSEQQEFVTLYRIYWIVALLVLLGIIVTAGIDLIVLRRFSLREHRKIQADRRAMIEEEVAIIRRRLNGRH